MRRQKTRGLAASVIVGLSSLACTTPPTPITPPPPRGSNQGGPSIPRVGSETEAATLDFETITQLQAGGPVAASRHGGDCRGYVGFAPNFRVAVADARPVRFMAQGDRDLTIVVVGPTGQWWCNDDSDGLNPMVEITGPIPGLYSVYIGTYGTDRSLASALVTTDLTRTPTQMAGHTVTVPLSHEVETATGANAAAVGEACSVEQDLSDAAQTHWRVTCGVRVYYNGALPPNDPTWPTGTIAYDAATTSADQTPSFVWNAEGITLRDDASGALGEFEMHLRARTSPFVPAPSPMPVVEQEF